jgi:hypothetical protein
MSLGLAVARIVKIGSTSPAGVWATQVVSYDRTQTSPDAPNLPRVRCSSLRFFDGDRHRNACARVRLLC